MSNYSDGFDDGVVEGRLQFIESLEKYLEDNYESLTNQTAAAFLEDFVEKNS